MRTSLILFFVVFIVSCNQNVARRPKTQTPNNFYKEVVEQNKKLNKREELMIENVLKKDTINAFNVSSSGFWYTYFVKDSLANITPKTNDVVTLEYNIMDLYGNEIYKNQELTYKVDKENIITGLAEGVKLMKEGEEMLFVIPSYVAYGIVGDGNKIGINKTLKSRVKLNKIKRTKNENN